jgi:class 3 adenylate cyclase/pimeloyl-ACP methyl ester carboxylesterase
MPETQYAKTPDGVYLAYQVAGDGPVDVAWQPDYVNDVDLVWDSPNLGRLFRGIASFARLILHDRRGTGLSSRNVPPPNLETRVADLRVVLDAAGSVRPVLAGRIEGATPGMLLAASDPGRIQSIVWWGPSARSVWSPEYPWGVRPQYVELDQRQLQHWGTLEGARLWAEGEAMYGRAFSEEEIRMWAKLSRHTATPDVAQELSRIWYETDIRSVLPSVKVPTLLLDSLITPADEEETQYIASLMPFSEVKPLPQGVPESEVVSAVVDEIRRFSGIEPPEPDLDTMLATIMFTDIVGSTHTQASLGDRGWKNLIERHHALVRQALQRWKGVEVDTAGDGFYATFDGPARAIRCALGITREVRELGIEVRAGLHTGECEIVDGKCSGIAVTTGSRVCSTAGPSEVRVSQTVKDLVAGSGLRFEDAGEHKLKGVPDHWHLYRVLE